MDLGSLTGSGADLSFDPDAEWGQTEEAGTHWVSIWKGRRDTAIPGNDKGAVGAEEEKGNDPGSWRRNTRDRLKFPELCPRVPPSGKAPDFDFAPSRFESSITIWKLTLYTTQPSTLYMFNFDK